MSDEPKRGRSIHYAGPMSWLVDIITKGIANLPPGESVEIELYRYMYPETQYGIRIRPGKRQKETLENLGLKEIK